MAKVFCLKRRRTGVEVVVPTCTCTEDDEAIRLEELLAGAGVTGNELCPLEVAGEEELEEAPVESAVATGKRQACGDGSASFFFFIRLAELFRDFQFGDLHAGLI